MADTFQFKLVTPTGVLFDGPVEQVTAVGALGEFGVLPLHINYITSLVPGILTIKISEGRFEELWLAGGLAEVKDGVMTVLATDALQPEKIDTQKAAAEVPNAESKVAGMSFYDLGYSEAVQAAQVARTQAEINQLRRALH
ncbi:MAG TPA: ATP synthase F1 subunit epsilon [Candidatus Binataceae bacterium]|nr:ATP synthase F1 subunit epsilon [Candidatus Binataceae bacterium]